MEASRERKMMQVHLRLWNNVPQTGLFASSVWLKFLEDSHRWFQELGGSSRIDFEHVTGAECSIHPTGVVVLRRESKFQNRIIEQVSIVARKILILKSRSRFDFQIISILLQADHAVSLLMLKSFPELSMCDPRYL